MKNPNEKINVQDQQSTITGEVGTLFFMEPEILNTGQNYNETAEVYSFGVLMFNMLSDVNMLTNTVDVVSYDVRDISGKVAVKKNKWLKLEKLCSTCKEILRQIESLRWAEAKRS